MRDAGLAEADLPAIEAAITAHSAPGEMKRAHEHWALTALLKDADGLDRVRLGDLDPRYFRHPEAHGMIDFAQALFDVTDGVLAPGEGHFAALWVEAERLERVG